MLFVPSRKLALMALSGPVEWYWPELMSEKELAICLRALSGVLRLSNMSVCELCVGDGSSIVAYEATRNDGAICSCSCVKIQMKIC